MRATIAVAGAVMLSTVFTSYPTVASRMIASGNEYARNEKPCEQQRAPRPRVARDERRAECPREQATPTAIALLPANAPDTTVAES
jgi:hypothetical protein